MCKGIIGKKLGMTGIYTPEGKYVPVTVIQAGPCVVTQIKTVATDGYDALQLGFGDKKATRVNKPLKGHMNKSGDRLFTILKEFSVENPEKFETGQEISLNMFKIGEKVDIVGTTKGRGFSGVIKRHGFSGGPMAHGSKCKRIPGSIGTSAWPSRVAKGRKMPGRYGMDRKTMKNLVIADIRPDQNLVLIKGAIPGPTTGLVEIKKPKFAK